MNKKLLFAFSILSGLGFSQSFDATNENAIGATQTMYQLDSSATTYSAEIGASAVWDYSTFLNMPNNVKTYSVVANANTADYGVNTNKMIDIQNVLTSYFETNASGREIVGIEYNTQNTQIGTIKINFNGGNKISAMTYPFALTNSIVDDCSGNLTSTSSFIPLSPASGSSISTYDGIGTLKLFGGVTLNNVSRHHMTTTINSTINLGILGTVNVVLIIDQYDYYNLASGDYLPEFSFVNTNINATGSVPFSSNLNFVLSNVDPVQHVGLTNNTLNQLDIYPNPAKEQISISSTLLNGNEIFTVSTLEGKQVLVSENSNKVDVSTLPKGVYVVSTEINGASVNQKFIKD